MKKTDKLFTASALLEVLEGEQEDCARLKKEYTEVELEAESLKIICEALKFYKEEYTNW